MRPSKESNSRKIQTSAVQNDTVRPSGGSVVEQLFTGAQVVQIITDLTVRLMRPQLPTKAEGPEDINVADATTIVNDAIHSTRVAGVARGPRRIAVGNRLIALGNEILSGKVTTARAASEFQAAEPKLVGGPLP